jgi:hypothetical protein
MKSKKQSMKEKRKSTSVKSSKTTGTKRSLETTPKPFYISLINQLNALKAGTVTYNNPGDGNGWIDYKIKNKILSFSLDDAGNLDDVGLFREIKQVVDQKKIF